jgi:hypothetical protein
MELDPEFPSQGPAQRSQVAAGDPELQRLIPTDRRNHRALLGFFNEQEVRQFLQGKVQSAEQFDEIMGRWGVARSRICALPPFLNEPEIRPILEPEVLLEIEKVMQLPECKQAFPEGTWSVSLVELSGIIAFQPGLDTEYASGGGEDPLSPGDLLSAVKISFPFGKTSTLAVSMDQAQKAITVSGVNPSLQVVGLTWGQQAAIGPFAITFFVSAGPNVMQVSRYRGRCFLSNGYHRAYRLMKAGFTHIPCLLRNASDFAQTGAFGAGFFPESILMSPRPPLFIDFEDGDLGIDVPVHSAKKMVRIRPDEFLAIG